MHFFFADDSSQRGNRLKMGKIVAYGGILVPSDRTLELSHVIDQIAEKAGIPDREEIKWSPRKNSWIYNNLGGEDRFNCYSSILKATEQAGATVIATVCDPEMRHLRLEWGFERCVTYTLERVSAYTENLESQTVVISDRPSGGKREEDQFLLDYLDHIESDYNFMIKGNFALNMLTAPSHLVRLLQVADLVTAITTAMVSGQTKYAKDYFGLVMPMFAKNALGSVGGTGLKVYPDNLINLYHWVLGEQHFSKASRMAGIPLPHSSYLYYENDGT
ncbi:MAG: hypothetical protein Q7L19_01720 [Pseudohongiella sp.]|nr:hypothetical protein [Pseudohongiella sp.]